MKGGRAGDNKIEGTPIIKLAMIKRSKVLKNLKEPQETARNLKILLIYSKSLDREKNWEKDEKDEIVLVIEKNF